MLPVQRKQTIMDHLGQHGAVSIAGLSELLNVSEMTVRRDLKLLEEEGRIRRTHGGAVYHTAAAEPPFEEKKDRHLDVKHRLARYAAEHFVKPDSVILMEGGTTVTCMAGFLHHVGGLTVVTNGLNTLDALKGHAPATSVVCCGGMLRDRSYTFVGPLAEQFFQGIHAHCAFFSASGLTIGQGFADPNMLEVQVKKAMGRAAQTRIMLIDSSKFGNLALLTTFAVHEIDVVVTDRAAPADLLGQLREAGVDVRLAD
ncbi:DeoR/GlpR family DNA-binding transcription regulator [Paenibacillus hodogayensis]|uniref:DeoR/GlpR family DNA-binding transcription regulator n=1 Tax=Paenibacillus hodogayensis TaxID=279208 RepID=A0ABV5VY59_9BACL